MIWRRQIAKWRDAPPLPSEDHQYGSAFEKAEQYDKHLDDPNAWHPDLRRPLFTSQVIGFRWMADRHLEGGGIVAEKVGIGKVGSPSHMLWLEEQLEQRRQGSEAETAKALAARAPAERKLCLSVLVSAALANAWVNTLNNDAIMACRAAEKSGNAMLKFAIRANGAISWETISCSQTTKIRNAILPQYVRAVMSSSKRDRHFPKRGEKRTDGKTLPPGKSIWLQQHFKARHLKDLSRGTSKILTRGCTLEICAEGEERRWRREQDSRA